MMSDEFAQGIMAHVAHHLPHARTIRARLLPSHAQDAHAFCTEMAVRIDRYFAEVTEIPSFDQKPTQPQHFQAFRNSLRHARALDHYVGTAPMGQTAQE